LKYFVYIEIELNSYQNILKVFKQQFTKVFHKAIYKMSSNTDTNTVRSICIPRVFDNIGEERIREIFKKLAIFEIARIDVIQKQGIKGDKFKRVFIHIKSWSDRSDAIKARDRLLAGKDLKIVYDDPWFWKVAVNKWAPKAQVPPPPKPKIRIEFDIEEDDEPTIQSKNAEAAARVLANVPPRHKKEDNRKPEKHHDDRHQRPEKHHDDRHQRPDDRYRPTQHPDDRYRPTQHPDDRYRRDDRYRPTQHPDDRYRPTQHPDDRYRRDDRYRPTQHHDDRYQRPDNRNPIAPALSYAPVADRDHRDGAYYEQERQQAILLEASVAVPVSLEPEIQAAVAELTAETVVVEPEIQAAVAELTTETIVVEPEIQAAVAELTTETVVVEPEIQAAAAELTTETIVVEPVLIKITPENVNQYIGEDITFKNGGEYVVRKILRASETGKTIEIDYPELKNNLQIVTRNVFLNNGAKMATEPSKPRYIKVSDKKALNAILANALA
jgi:hypothetical protein